MILRCLPDRRKPPRDAGGGDQFIPVAFRSGASIQWEFGRQRKLSSSVGDEGDEDAQADSVSTSQTVIIRIDGVRIIALVPRLR